MQERAMQERGRRSVRQLERCRTLLQGCGERDEEEATWGYVST